MLELFLAPAAVAGAQPETVIVQPEPLPPGVRRMLSAAMRFDDPEQAEAVISAAKSAYPDQAGQIDRFVEELQKPVAPLKIAPLVVVAPVDVQIEEAELEKPTYWDDLNAELTLNAVQTKGNSDTFHLGMHGKVNLMRRAQIHRLEGYGNASRANGVQNQRNWGASYQLDTVWTDRYFGYVRGSIDRDAFSGFETSAFAGVGAGTYLVQQDALTIRSELGPGYRLLKLSEEDRSIDGVGIYGSFELDWAVNEDWNFEFDSKATLSEPTSTFNPTLRLNAAVTDQVRAGVSYDFRYETDPPLMSENYDSSLKFDVMFHY